MADDPTYVHATHSMGRMMIHGGVGAPAPPVSDWILTGGIWNDAGFWRDTSFWED